MPINPTIAKTSKNTPQAITPPIIPFDVKLIDFAYAETDIRMMESN